VKGARTVPDEQRCLRTSEVDCYKLGTFLLCECAVPISCQYAGRRVVGEALPTFRYESAVEECIGDLALVEDSEAPQTQIAGLNPVYQD
jgi:hypothetical protein